MESINTQSKFVNFLWDRKNGEVILNRLMVEVLLKHFHLKSESLKLFIKPVPDPFPFCVNNRGSEFSIKGKILSCYGRTVISTRKSFKGQSAFSVVTVNLV